MLCHAAVLSFIFYFRAPFAYDAMSFFYCIVLFHSFINSFIIVDSSFVSSLCRLYGSMLDGMLDSRLVRVVE